MKKQQFLPILHRLVCSAVCLFLFCAAGCYSNSDFVPKTEEELAAMELENTKANQRFCQGNYDSAAEILKRLTAERTVSRPLYQLEMLSVLLMTEKYEEAHKLMLVLNEDFETLFDPQSEKKAKSVWHGEVNKVFKGDAYERSTFYALLALSFIRKGNYEDALRAVKNGLLAEADANSEQALEDYGLLHYLGYFAARKMKDHDMGAEYLRALHSGLQNRGFQVEDYTGKSLKQHCFQQLEDSGHNVLLVVWTGSSPEIFCTGEYKEVRSIVRGTQPYDMMTVAVAGNPATIVPNNLGDINYQASTRGGRLMDQVLADKAAAKAAMKTGGNVLFVVGTGLLIAGSRTMGVMPLGLSLLGAGLGCYVVGGTCHIAGVLMNPAADGRFWRNLPGQLYIVPLKLDPGKHQIMLTGYNCFEPAGNAFFNIEVKPGQTNVIHLPMMNSVNSGLGRAREMNFYHERQIIQGSDRFQKEIK